MNQPVIDIYLAVPYSDLDTELQEYRYDQVTEAYARICRTGMVCFSPITHSHVAAIRYGLPGNHEYWEAHNKAFMIMSRALWILTLPGWMESDGVTKEIQWAKQLGLPIVLLESPDAEPKLHWDADFDIQGDGYLPSISLGKLT